MKEKVLGTALEIGGGAAAGYLDTKFADKKVAGQGLGTALAVAGVAYGFVGKGKLSKLALDLGAGAAAFEVGKMVANKQSAGSVSGVGRAVGRLPQSTHVVTPDEMRAAFARHAR